MVCMKRIKQQRWWEPFVRFIKFVVHFLMVMLALFIGALVFATIEDPLSGKHKFYNINKSNHGHTELKQFIFINESTVPNFTVILGRNTTESLHDTKELSSNISHLFISLNKTLFADEFFKEGNTTLFWAYMKDRYNITINDDVQNNFLNDVDFLLHAIIQRKKAVLYEEKVQDRRFIFIKWFYFVIIATTTIGYGDVYPETTYGKIFYILFSLFGIPLVMTLLASCGDIMTAVNKSLFRVINNCLCKKKKLISEELLSTISISLLFISYVTIGCVFNVLFEHWELVDSIYFWIVTFTTVGFGDLNQSLETQIDYFAPLIIYRVFGLALLAGVVDSSVAWVKIRKEAFAQGALKMTNASFAHASKKKQEESFKDEEDEKDNFLVEDITKVNSSDFWL